LRDVARALAYAHQRGVVHRDIKPDNVLMSGGAAVVTDFGIAKAISAARTAAAGATLTQIGTSIGTPAYMAPEQAAGDPDIDHRADLYALGAMAYEMLSGQPVFANRTAQRMMAAHMGETPTPIATLRGDLPAALAELVMRCLAKDPNARPQSAGEIAHALDTITSGGGMPAMPAILLGGPGMFRKALAIYAASFVAVAILARAAIVGIGLPDWVFPGALIVMALGLPMVLWTGYVQRVTRRAMTMTPTYTPGGTPSVAGGTIATMAFKAAPHVSWYRTARGGMYALGVFVVIVAGVMTLRVLGIGPAGSLLAAGKLTAKEPILMTDFSATNGDTALARVVSFAVRTGLSESPVLSIVSQAQTADALQLMEQPRTERVDLPLAQQIAQRNGITAIVDGVVTPVGSGYVVTVRLLTADSARALASFQETGDGPKGLIDASDRIARDLRAKAGESLHSVQAAPRLAAVTTGSLDALRAYSAGSFAADAELDRPKSIRLLTEAVAADTTFAEGWRKLAMEKVNLGLPRSQVASALVRAFQFRNALPQPERLTIEATYDTYGPSPDRPKAIAAYEQLLQVTGQPGNNNLALLFASERDFAKADSQYRLVLRSNPGFLLAYGNLVATLRDEGSTNAADSVVRVMLQRFPTATTPKQFAVLGLYFVQKWDAYGQALDSARNVRDPTNPGWSLWRSAELALLRGHVADWRRLRTAAAAAAADSTAGYAPPTAVGDATTVAWVDAVVLEQPAITAATLDSALARTPLRRFRDEDRPDLAVASAYAQAGRPDRAEAVLVQYRAQVRDTAVHRVHEPDEHAALAESALARRKFPEAAAQFRKADSLPDGPANDCTICLPLNLARVFDAAGMPDSAIAEFDLYLKTPYRARYVETLDASVLPMVHERLGQLYEAKGDTTKAAAQYLAFIDLWKSADPELQPRVADARRRLARLSQLEKRR
ncbi:MAG TPA: protein kinase, partial [Gemmatimonadaceae bacterium]|nr:protein kinase [Gemmatimonadaceae bacterium]